MVGANPSFSSVGRLDPFVSLINDWAAERTYWQAASISGHLKINVLHEGGYPGPDGQVGESQLELWIKVQVLTREDGTKHPHDCPPSQGEGGALGTFWG